MPSYTYSIFRYFEPEKTPNAPLYTFRIERPTRAEADREAARRLGIYAVNLAPDFFYDHLRLVRLAPGVHVERASGDHTPDVVVATRPWRGTTTLVDPEPSCFLCDRVAARRAHGDEFGDGIDLCEFCATPAGYTDDAEAVA